MHSTPHRLMLTLAIGVLLAAASVAPASDAAPSPPCPPPERATVAPAPAPPAVAGEAPDTTAPHARGFAGTLVDLSCDVVRLANGTARCDDGEHHFALRVDGERGLRPLEVAHSRAVSDALHTGDLTGRQVCVTGDASPSGVLRVDGIQPLG